MKELFNLIKVHPIKTTLIIIAAPVCINLFCGLIAIFFIGEGWIEVDNAEYLEAINKAVESQDIHFIEIDENSKIEDAVFYLDADDYYDTEPEKIYIEDISLLEEFNASFYCPELNIYITLENVFIYESWNDPPNLSYTYDGQSVIISITDLENNIIPEETNTKVFVLGSGIKFGRPSSGRKLAINYVTDGVLYFLERL